MIIPITEKETDHFLPLIPEDMQNAVKCGKLKALGALSEDGEDSGEDDTAEACGVVLFSSEDGMEIEGGRGRMIVLHWIFVAEKHRQKGVANDLMDALSDILEDDPAEGIICNIPMGSEYDQAENFLTSWGFSFEVTELQEMVITKDDCRREISPVNKEMALKLASGPERPLNLIPVSDLSKADFKKTVRTMKEEEKSGYYDPIPEDRDAYAPDMSYAFVREDQVSSMALFEKLPDGDLHMAMLGTLSKRGAKELLELLRYCAGYYYLNYPEEAKVRLSLGIERSRNLAMYLFPDKEPIPVRRGCYF